MKLGLLFALGGGPFVLACSDDEDQVGTDAGRAGQAGQGGGNAGAPQSMGGRTGGAGAEAGRGGSTGGRATGGAESSGGAGGQDTESGACKFPAQAEIGNAAVPPGFCAYTWAGSLDSPRGILVDPNGDVLVVEQDASRVTLLYDDDEDGVSGSSERVQLGNQAGINHGLALHDGYLYASSATTVFRWRYPGDRQPLGNSEQVVTGIPGGGHRTRTLLFDAQGRLYVSIGSGGNVDADSSRARLIRYPASALTGTSTFAQGELFADGLRNEVGLTLDSQGRVWGVENERDNLMRTDLGGDIHDDNPAEELNLFLEANAGRFYGYPYCWSEGNLPNSGMGPGTQWAHPSTMDDGTHTDAWCRDTDNVLPPILTMQAHSAPLDLIFYSAAAFPEEMRGDALITFHGSWNRSTATGYKVVRVPFGPDGMPSATTPVPLFESASPGDRDAQWRYRPVGLAIGDRGQLYVTSDNNGEIVVIGYRGT